MAKVQVTAAGYVCSMDVPTDEQLTESLKAHLMLTIAAEAFSAIAQPPTGAGQPSTDRNNQLTAIAALQEKMDDLRDAALPALVLTPE